MKRPLIIFYAVAMAFHAAVLFYLKPPAPKPPKIFNETYVDVTLTTPPPPQPEPNPIVVPPKPEEKPQPPPPPKPEMTIPEPKPKLPSPPVAQPIIVPPPKPPVQEYVPVTQPNFAKQAEHVYPPEAARRHQQGTVILMLYINSGGTMDKIEIVKSSGFPLLDAAAIHEMKQSKFEPAMDGAIPVRSRAQASVIYKLE
jgi:periplasmic protein TonB